MELPPTISDVSGSAADVSGIHILVSDGQPATATATSTEKPAKLSYRAVDTIIKTMYTDPNTARSTALDILAIYLKGQKILYTEAKMYCERRLIRLMLPAISISCLTTLLGAQLRGVPYGDTVVAVLNGINTFILAWVSYLKLDAKAESHKISAYKYDKLQAFCEFKSGKILFLNDDKENVNTIIDQIETQVKEIKETNQFVLPERIRHMFRNTYGLNVFAKVKEIQTKETLLMNELKGHINRLVNLHEASPRDLEAIQSAEDEQNETISKIVALRDEFLKIDKVFETEITRSIDVARRRRRCPIC